jgi:UDP-N-acetylmuramoyl-tripeptide--D-alanyl-D-alanine ligase
MRELGPSSDRFHREVGQAAAATSLDLLYCVGPQAKLIAEAAIQAGMAAEQVHHFADSEKAAEALATAFGPGDTVLLKASRTVKLERVAAAITQGRTHGFFPKESAAG